MDDYLEIGKALKAEKVVGIDIESFSVLDGQTLFRGRATVSIQVYDVAEKQVEWHKSPPQIEYPRIGSTPVQDAPGNGIPQSVRGHSRRADCPLLLSPRPARRLRSDVAEHSPAPILPRYERTPPTVFE